MYKFLFVAFASISLVCCKPTAENSAQNTDAAFDTYKTEFIDRLWKMYPGWASSAGFHNYDSLLTIPNSAFRQMEITFAETELAKLKEFALDSLSANNKTDYYLIENQLKSTVWGINKQKSFEWDPSGYNVCGGFAEILNGTYDSLDTRLKNISIRLLSVPDFYAAASENILNPTLEHTQLAIDQNLGGLSVFTTDLPALLQKSGLTQIEKDSILARAKRAELAINTFVDGLKNLDNKQPRSFRLGSELYKEKFAFEIQSNYSPEQIYEKALNHKKDLHHKMADIARSIWTKHMGTALQPADSLLMIRQLIDKLSLKHANRDSFQAAIEKQIPALEKFVNEHKLLYLDPKKPLVVRREPDYMAGVAGASISAPGPYDKNGNTYYNVGSLTGWSNEQAESYLREYNDYILQILNIHEAIPGHYTQLVYSNQSPSIIKAILGNGAMVEGWAVYTERMMLESGYGAATSTSSVAGTSSSSTSSDSAEMWLMYYKWNLRTTCNTILDYSVHNLNFSKEAAINLLVNEAFQQQAEADGKWKRATLTQVQLCSYFTGYSEIYDLREELKQKQGTAFDLKKFHEQFLSYGSAPVKHIRGLMVE